MKKKRIIFFVLVFILPPVLFSSCELYIDLFRTVDVLIFNNSSNRTITKFDIGGYSGSNNLEILYDNDENVFKPIGPKKTGTLRVRFMNEGTVYWVSISDSYYKYIRDITHDGSSDLIIRYSGSDVSVSN